MSEQVINIKRTKSKKIVEPNELKGELDVSTIKLSEINIMNEDKDNKQSSKNDIWKHIFNEIKYNGDR